MKYLSVLFFALAFTWTWNAITSIPAIGIQTHSGIQASMAELIAKSVSTKKPTAKDLIIQRMKTQEGENGEVHVFFQYKFSEYDSDNNVVWSQISGVATLERSTKQQDEQTADQPDNKTDHWVLKKTATTSDIITFEEGLRVTPGPEVPTSAEPLTEAIPEPTQPAEPAKTTTE